METFDKRWCISFGGKNKTTNIVVLYMSSKSQCNLKREKLNPKACAFTIYKCSLLILGDELAEHFPFAVP